MKSNIKLIDDINQIIKSIQDSQTQENILHNKLIDTDNKSRQPIYNDIEILTNNRITLYNTLNDNYKLLKQQKLDLKKDTAGELIITDIIENDLNTNKQNLEKKVSDKTNKQRLIQINTYYSKQFREWSKVIKLLILIIIPLLIIVIIKKKNIIPDKISNIIIMFILSVGGIYIMYRVVDLLLRDNINFDEYYMPMNVDTDELDFNKYNEYDTDLNNVNNLEYCVGNMCCSTGMEYDYELHKCLPLLSENYNMR
jgi:hypothetical protein